MSSHHIVREKQEPALYIHELGNFSGELLGQLLEWSPTLIVHEDEYERVLSMGIKVDHIAGTHQPEGQQEHTGYIAGTDILKVITRLKELGYPALNIIGQGRGQNVLETERGINLVWFNANEKTFAIKSSFKFWKPAGTRFWLNGAGKIVATNLIEQHDGWYEAVEDGFVSFTFDEPVLLITEQL